MPLISPKEEGLLEPLTEELARRLSSNYGLAIDRFRLKEFIFSRAKKEILSQHPDWSEEGKLQPGALKRQSQFNAVIDLINMSSLLVEDIISYFNEPPPVIETPHPAVFRSKLKQKVTVREIDQNIGPFGKTRLHLAVDARNLDEVKRLVEVEGAYTGVKDNAGKTPWDRANLADFTEIANYLSNFGI